MPNPQLSNLFLKLHNNAAFLQQFAQAPAQVLSQEGYDANMLALPSKIDPVSLKNRLNQIFNGNHPSPADPATVNQLSPDDLWNRFGIIGLKPEDRALVAADDTSAVAVVVYGSSMVTSTVTSGTEVAAVTSGKVASLKSLEQIKVLRLLTQQPKESLSFSITGPDGVAVDHVSADTLRAFLGRLNR